MENNKRLDKQNKDMLLSYIKGESGHFFLEFADGTGVLRVEDDKGHTIARLVLSNKRSIDLFEQRLLFLKKLLFDSNYASSHDVVTDLLSEQEFVGRLLE